MTEFSNKMVPEQEVLTDSSDESSLTTREIMEKHWDELVLNKSESSSELTKDTDAAVEKQLKDNFDIQKYVSDSYDDIKDGLIKKGVDTKEKWLKNVIDLAKSFQQNPKEVLRQLAIEAAVPLPRKEDVPYLISKLGQNPIYRHLLYQQNNGMPVDLLEQVNRGLNKANQENLQQIVKNEIAAFFKQNQIANQKAKNASFSPNGKSFKHSVSATHRPDGRLKTTREILEEGCALFGI